MPDDILPPLPPGTAPEAKKEGLFRRMFGRKKEDDANTPYLVSKELSTPEPKKDSDDINLEQIRKQLGLEDKTEPVVPVPAKTDASSETQPEPKQEDESILERMAKPVEEEKANPTGEFTHEPETSTPQAKSSTSWTDDVTHGQEPKKESEFSKESQKENEGTEVETPENFKVVAEPETLEVEVEGEEESAPKGKPGKKGKKEEKQKGKKGKDAKLGKKASEDKTTKLIEEAIESANETSQPTDKNAAGRTEAAETAKWTADDENESSDELKAPKAATMRAEVEEELKFEKKTRMALSKLEKKFKKIMDREMDRLERAYKRKTQEVEHERISLAGSIQKYEFKIKQLGKEREEFHKEAEHKKKIVAEELKEIKEELHKDRNEHRKLSEELPALRKHHEALKAKIDVIEERIRLNEKLEETITKREQALSEAQKRLEEAEIRIKKNGFSEYLDSELRGGRIVSEQILQKNPVMARHLEIYNDVDRCKSYIKDKNIAEAKKIYNLLRGSYHNLKITQSEKEMLYTTIRELYDDITLAMLDSEQQ